MYRILILLSFAPIILQLLLIRSYTITIEHLRQAYPCDQKYCLYPVGYDVSGIYFQGIWFAYFVNILVICTYLYWGQTRHSLLPHWSERVFQSLVFATLTSSTVVLGLALAENELLIPSYLTYTFNVVVMGTGPLILIGPGIIVEKWLSMYDPTNEPINRLYGEIL